MSEEKIQEIACAADLIVDGYAMLRDGARVKVVHLYTGRVVVVDDTQGVLESTMDEIEEVLALRHLAVNRQFLAA